MRARPVISHALTRAHYLYLVCYDLIGSLSPRPLAFLDHPMSSYLPDYSSQAG